MTRPPHAAHRLLLRGPARGQFNLPTLLVLLVLLVVAVIALRYALHEASLKQAQKDAQRSEARAASPEAKGAPQTPPPTVSPSPRPDAHGLSFALMPLAAGAPMDAVHVGCHGEPKIFGRPHEGSCNPYQGDTACNIVLPVLCVKPDAAAAPIGLATDFYSGWVGGSLGASEPVMGALLDSPQAATAHCERSLGAGWRAAEFHDGQGGWGLQGRRGPGLRENSRYWVRIGDQPGNCWN